MLVKRSEFANVVQGLKSPQWYGLDTETKWIKEEHAQELFALIIYDGKQPYYFNFEKYQGIKEEDFLPRSFLKDLAPVIENPQSTFCIHNAKFDMRVLAREGLLIKGSVHCTEAVARVLQNNYFGKKPYSLDSCAARIGLKKDDRVAAYVEEHRLNTKISIPGKKKKVTMPHFEKVPFSLMLEYAEKDAFLHYTLAKDQEKKLQSLPQLVDVTNNEKKLTKVCFDIEQIGMKINRNYTEQALSYELQKIKELKENFKTTTGIEFIDSNVIFTEVFKKFNITPPLTEKGNPSFKDEVLEDFDHPVAELIRNIRHHEMRSGTFYSSILFFADKNDTIHANMRQAGTETGRFSYSDPNLQNLPKEEEVTEEQEKYLVRGCFIPRPGYCFVMIDFDQQEFRVMLDYANESELIKAILNGVDVHQATADLIGCTRKQAKTINFGLLYGMGAEKLAKRLNLSVADAKKLKEEYFRKLPGVRSFISQVIYRGKNIGYVRNWKGRRCYISDSEFAYILPNHIIQGGCADVVKFAMVELAEFLKNKKSRMVCQVHDEILFEVHETEIEIISELKRIMESIYKPFSGMKLTCSVEHSYKSWGQRDKIKGIPGGTETGNKIQTQSGSYS